MPSLFARAYKPVGDPDALGDVLTIAELAELRLSGPGKRPTPEQKSRLELCMLDQVSIERLITVHRRTRLPAKPIPSTYLWEIGLSDHYRVDPFYMGKSRFELRVHAMGPTPNRDAVAIEFPPDRVEFVVTRQATRDLYAIDSENWSDAALTWCNADKHLSLQEELARLGVPMRADEVETLKIETRRKRELKPEIMLYLEKSGYRHLTVSSIMDKKTSELYPWVKLADTGTHGYCYRHLLLRLFEVMMPPKVKRDQPGLHLIEIEADRRQA